MYCAIGSSVCYLPRAGRIRYASAPLATKLRRYSLYYEVYIFFISPNIPSTAKGYIMLELGWGAIVRSTCKRHYFYSIHDTIDTYIYMHKKRNTLGKGRIRSE